MKLHIVMVEPEIPQNTGNIARTCAITGAKLHLVYPLGFKIDDKQLKRAGLDYWDKLEIEEHTSLDAFLEKYKPEEHNMFMATTKAKHCYTDVDYSKFKDEDVFVLFGKETKGLPEDLLQKYPTFTPKEREDAITKEYGAVFIIGIGCKLSNGEKHDGRAPDYDDWSTIAENGQVGLNGDLLVWDEVLNRSLELSSMGIRVDKEALLRQLEICNAEEKKELYFHKRLLNNELPLSIGGGIGQSRLCMFYLRKAHIGEIQASIWPEEMRREARAAGMYLI